MDRVIKVEGIIVEQLDPMLELFFGSCVEGYFTIRDFTNKIQDLNRGDNLTIEVYTDGGSIDAGVRIYNECKRLRQKGVNIKTLNLGKQHSIGNVVMLGGTVRTGFASSEGVVHLPRIDESYFWGYRGGITSEDLRSIAEELDIARDRILNIYVEETQKPYEAMKKLMYKEMTLNSKQLLNFGFLTDIDGGVSPATISNLKTFKGVGKYQNLAFGRSIFNLKNVSMSKQNETSKPRKLLNAIVGILQAGGFRQAANYTFDTAGGDTLEVDREDDKLQVGDSATINGDQTDGEITLDDGRVVTVTGGIISSIAQGDGGQEGGQGGTNQELENLRAEVANLKAANEKLTRDLTNVNALIIPLQKELDELENIHTNYNPAGRSPLPKQKTNVSGGQGAQSTKEDRDKIRKNLNK